MIKPSCTIASVERHFEGQSRSLSQARPIMKKQHLIGCLCLISLFWPMASLGANPVSNASTTVSSKAKPIGDKWAVVIGIGEFADPGIPTLKYAAKDAKDFYDYLVDPNLGKFRRDHVRLLTDKDATKINILDALGDSFLPHAANPDDLIVIYLSTHGSPSRADINGVNYVLAHDTQKKKLFATGIEMQQLLRTIKERVHSDRLLLVMDTCYSGAGAEKGDKGLYRTNADGKAIAQGTGSMVITSSSPDQKAWESDDLRNSYFTKYLIDALKEKSGNATIDEAFAAMAGKVQQAVLKDKGALQTPLIAGKVTGPNLLLSVTPTINRPAPIVVANEAMAAAQAQSAVGNSSKAANLDFTAYVEHIKAGNKLFEENKIWDAIHEIQAACKANPQTIEGYIILAHLLDSQGRYQEMMTAARQAVLNDKDSSRAKEALGLAYYRLGDANEALRQVQMAVALDPFNSMARTLLGYINEHKLNRVDVAEQEYRKALDLNNLNTRALVNLGTLLDSQGKTQEAQKLFEKAIESDADDYQAHLALGHLLYRDKKDLLGAEKEIRTAMRLAPENATIHAELGTVLALDAKRLDEAEGELKKGIEIAKDQGTPHFLYANFLLQHRGRIDEAEREYRNALELDDSLDECMVALGDLLVSKRKVFDEADKQYKKALRINPRNPYAHLGIARVQELLFKNYAQAETSIKAAIAIKPDLSLSYERLGEVFEKAGKPNDAKQAYMQALSKDSNNALASFNLGMLTWNYYKNKDEAKKYLEQAAEKAPDVSSYTTELGHLMANEFKQYKPAEALLRKASQVNFQDTDAHYYLGMLLIEKLGQRKSGEEELKCAYQQKPDDKQIKSAYERFVR